MAHEVFDITDGTRGYLSEAYANALDEVGVPVPLGSAGGWCLARDVAGSELKDATGAYPLLCCRNWGALPDDLARMRGSFVSFVAVTDPLGDYDSGVLMRCFPDWLRRYKEHYVASLSDPLESFVTRHHRREARRALRQVEVHQADTPEAHGADWKRLYASLIARRGIRGTAAFSAQSLAAQLRVPGARMFGARSGGATVSVQLWYEQGAVAYYHLAASDSVGYQHGAAYALTWAALEYFRGRGLDMVDLGSAPGLEQSAGHGLNRFKSGWATETRPAYLGGVILDAPEYARLTARGGGAFFPAYRGADLDARDGRD